MYGFLKTGRSNITGRPISRVVEKKDWETGLFKRHEDAYFRAERGEYYATGTTRGMREDAGKDCVDEEVEFDRKDFRFPVISGLKEHGIFYGQTLRQEGSCSGYLGTVLTDFDVEHHGVRRLREKIIYRNEWFVNIIASCITFEALLLKLECVPHSFCQIGDSVIFSCIKRT